MAFANFAAYKTQLLNAQVYDHYRDSITGASYPLVSMFSNASAKQYPTPRGGLGIVPAPTTAVACDSSTVGAWIRPVAGSGDQLVVASHFQPGFNDGGGVLIDRLSHQGGLSGTVTTSQTTNLPTAALTRYTSGEGVLAAIEVYTGVGATDAVWTVVYTNQAGTGSRSVSFLLSATPSLNTFITIPLQDADTGVRSVESMSLTPSTGTAGNFGITLYKPLVWIPPSLGRTGRPNDIFDMPGWNTPILDDACLQMLIKAQAAASTIQAQIYFGES